MNVNDRVDLDQDERAQLTALSRGGRIAARRLKRVQILPAADAGVDDAGMAEGLGLGGSTIHRTRRRFVEEGPEAALSEQPRPGGPRKPGTRPFCWRPPARNRPKDASAGR